MLTVADEHDLQMAKLVKLHDPFQLATPCWLVRSWYQLPNEVVKITIEDKNRMPIKVVAENEAPVQSVRRGILTNTNEYSEVLTALRTLQPGKALVVTLESPVFKEGAIKKGEMAFAQAFRRYFATEKLPMTAYASGKLEVTIKREKTVKK